MSELINIAEALQRNKNDTLQTAISLAEKEAGNHIAAINRLSENTANEIRNHANTHCSAQGDRLSTIVDAIESTMAEMTATTNKFKETVQETAYELTELDMQKQALDQAFVSAIKQILATNQITQD